jgi:hypothetical protein
VTPEQEEQVRRVLASAPAEGPMPPEVAARLDATLAELVAHRSPTEQDPQAVGPVPGPGGEVVSLEERRRRRWPKVLVAAASVSVLAYGVGVVTGGLGGGSAEMSTAGDSSGADSDAGAAGGRARSEEEAAPLPAEPDGEPTDSAVARRQLLSTDVVSLRTATLRRDVARVVGTGAVFSTDDAPKDGRTPADELTGLLDRVAARCEVPALAPGDRLSPARLDGRAATLVVRPPTDGTRVAEVYSCDDGTRLLAVTRISARR